MVKIGIYEARIHWSEMINRVANGEEITITRRGRPVAKLIPANDSGKASVAEAIAELHRFRSKHKLRGLSIKKMIEKGRM